MSDLLTRADNYPSRYGFGSTPQPDPEDDEPTDQAALEVSIDDDGGVTIKAPGPKPDETPDSFSENLALREGIDLGGIAEEILQGIEADQGTREGFIQNLIAGMDLLGLKIETLNSQSKSVSTVRHPILLEAVVKAQSAANGEMMPAAGPCKVQTIGATTAEEEQLATDFETDMNAYLTIGAPEYYPDFDRGLFGLFFSGNLFRKVHEHPLRQRPVAESIDVKDLIVSEDATDLETALRVTHRSEMAPSVIKRMMRAGVWCDVDLGYAGARTDGISIKEGDVLGMNTSASRPQDMVHVIYETTIDLDLADYGFKDRFAIKGLPVSYIVVVEKDSRKILHMMRGYKLDDMRTRKQRFVHYGVVPSFGFLNLGYVHLLGNQTKALTAIWRMLCDAGMFASFPGGVKLKGARTSTNEITPGPGEFTDIDGGADDIRKVLMPFPYKGPDPVLLEMAQYIEKATQGVGAAPNIEIGEGRTNVPVGTMMSLIEQQTQVMAAIHKRLHRAQSRELQLIKELFVENPAALAAAIPDPRRKWEAKEEFSSLDLVPASDPNIPAQIHRIQVSTALAQLAAQFPQFLDGREVLKRILANIKIGDADALMTPQQAPQAPPPDPKIVVAQMQAQQKQQQFAEQQQENQRKAAAAAVEAQTDQQETQADLANDQANRATQVKIAQMKEETERLRLAAEDRARRQEAAATLGGGSNGNGV